MADIKVRKRRSPVWPWIVGLIVVIIAVILIFDWVEREPDDEYDTGIVGSEEVYDDYSMQRSPVMEFDAFVNDRYDTTKIGGVAVNDTIDTADNRNVDTSKNNYAYYGVMLMSSAVADLVNDTTVTKDTTLADQAEKLQRDYGYDFSTAEDEKSLRQQIDNTVTLLAGIQQNSFPELKDEVNDLKQQAKRIDLENTEESKDQLKEFFAQVNTVISEMTEDGMLGERLGQNQVNERNEENR